MSDLTVIYYTSNRERPEFEGRIRRTLWRTIKPLRIPLISVSQQPLDFGTNICVGDVGMSMQNSYRQLLLGAMQARTPLVCTAEADHIYPREYFLFRPSNLETIYLAANLWVAFALRRRARCYAMKPRGDTSAMVVGRESVISYLHQCIDSLPEWRDEPDWRDGWLLTNVIQSLPGVPVDYFTTTIPVLSFKTDRQMHRKSTTRRGSKTTELCPFGSVNRLIRKYTP